MNLIVICIYNREQNLKHWLHCWAQCKQFDQLVIIHSDSGKDYDVPEGVIYLKRPNVGYDIGKFQDVCLNRMPGFPKEWDNLLWITDDCFPMIKDFATPFFEALKNPDVGVSCMEISPYVRKHVRTTGFAIKREVAQRLTFPADPITTKDHCYLFEHVNKPQERAGEDVNQHLLAQVERMGLKCAQVAPAESSPLYDTGYTRRLRHRELLHYKTFGREQVQLSSHSRQEVINSVPVTQPTISIICPIYDKYPQIISAMLCQTYQNWELNIIHDGPVEIEVPNDLRIIYTRIERKENDYGHTIRKEWLQKVKSDFVIITNGDNYYMPTFLQESIKAFNARPKSIAVYCNQIVHSYTGWKVMNCRLQRGFIDCGQVMLRTKEAQAVGWNSTDHSADWFFFNDIASRYGAGLFTAYNGCLFVHN